MQGADNNGGDRGQWSSRLGFILAAAGSAVGLGNMWRFPYVTGENGGGLFVLLYAVCIAVIGIPVLIAELVVGRNTQLAPAGAFRRMPGGNLAWSLVGWMGVLTGFIILSYYSVVAGWTFKYIQLALSGAFTGASPDAIKDTFANGVAGNFALSTTWHAVFMLVTIGIVVFGVGGGIERASKLLMPALLNLLLVLLAYASTQSGFQDGVSFALKPDPSKFKPQTVLEALGQSFFTLSLGMGALITYGSYLSRDTDLPSSAGIIAGVDTLVALLACLIMFPFIFTAGLEAGQGAGLAFISMPIAFGQMAGGAWLGASFFFLLLFAALTSAISLLEVVVSTVIDQLGWARVPTAIGAGLVIFLLGVPSARSGAFLDVLDTTVNTLLLPLGGLLIAIFVGWVVPREVSRDEFGSGSRFGILHTPWLWLLRIVVPLCIGSLLVHGIADWVSG